MHSTPKVWSPNHVSLGFCIGSYETVKREITENGNYMFVHCTFVDLLTILIELERVFNGVLKHSEWYLWLCFLNVSPLLCVCNLVCGEYSFGNVLSSSPCRRDPLVWETEDETQVRQIKLCMKLGLWISSHVFWINTCINPDVVSSSWIYNISSQHIFCM